MSIHAPDLGDPTRLETVARILDTHSRKLERAGRDYLAAANSMDWMGPRADACKHDLHERARRLLSEALDMRALASRMHRDAEARTHELRTRLRIERDVRRYLLLPTPPAILLRTALPPSGNPQWRAIGRMVGVH